MTTELSKVDSAALVPSDEETIKEAANLMVTGDLSKMTMVQKAQFLYKLAKAEGIPPFPPPYAIGKDNMGKEKIISTKNRAESLRKRDGISTKTLYKGPLRMGSEFNMEYYEVEVEGSTRDGRTATGTGVNYIKGAMGQELANKIMGCETKAQNRVTNSLSGSGLMDETEAVDSNMRMEHPKLEAPRVINPVRVIEAEVTGFAPAVPPVVK